MCTPGTRTQRKRVCLKMIDLLRLDSFNAHGIM